MQEIWKSIQLYPEYFVSNLGRVKSTKYKKERIIKPQLDHRGYLNVYLNKKRIRIHRLVAELFLDNPNKLPQVDHIDENKTNNTVHNLQWISNIDNNRKSKAKKLYTIDQNGNKVIFESQTQASFYFNIPQTTINRILRRIGKSKRNIEIYYE